MAPKTCKKCGKVLPENCDCKYCKDCKKKKKMVKTLVTATVVTGALVAGGIFVWNKQPEFIKKAVIKASNNKIKKTEDNLLKTARDLETKGQALLKKSEAIVKKVGRTAVTRF